MSDHRPPLPKFRGDLADHLSRHEQPESVRDAVRHRWFLYIVLALLVFAWGGGIASLILFGGPFGNSVRSGCSCSLSASGCEFT